MFRNHASGIELQLLIPGLAVACLLAIAPSRALAASFDCAKAGTLVEKAICADREISAADERLADAYKKLIGLAPNAELVRGEQRKWLSEVRDPCGNERGCLYWSYVKRMDELGYLIGVLDTPDSNEAKRRARLYKLREGKGKAVCEAMLKHYNAEISRFGVEQYSGAAFSQIRWRTLPFEGGGGLLALQTTSLDLYSNGANQTVVRYRTTGMGGPVVTAPFDIYMVAKLVDHWDRLPPNRMTIKEVSGKTSTMRPISYVFHYGQQVGRLYQPEIAAPFIFNNMTYVSLTEMAKTNANSGDGLPFEGVHIIAKYLANVAAYNEELERRRLLGKDREQLELQDKYLQTVCIFQR